MEEALKIIAEAKRDNTTYLDFSYSFFEELPNELGELENLTKLKLYRNDYLIDISALEKLTNLTTLYLSYNESLIDISVLKKLINLTILSLRRNESLTDILVLEKLTNLTILNLRYNKSLIDISVLENLTNLTILNLGYNKSLIDISVLSKLTNLTQLDLSDNPQFIDILALSKLTNLTKLSLRDNQLTDISVLSKLTNLTELDLRGNQLTDISPLKILLQKGNSISTDYSSEDGIFVGGNPLIHPPMSIVEKGNKAVLQYFKDMETQGVGKLNEAKLIIVGEPEAGKSSLMETLLNPKYELAPNAQSTLGIDVKPWRFQHPNEENRELTANIWDFGGQQIQYMTHQFFLTPDSVYLLVCANDRKESVNFDYWFKIIYLLGEKEGRYSPVLVVKNDKSDKFNFDFDIAHYQKQYPELTIEEQEVNLNKRGKEYDKLRETIEQMVSKLPLVNDVRPAQWSKIQDRLKLLAEDSAHISFEKYAQICEEHQVEEEASQILLSRYLHSTGSLLHFVDDEVLYNFVILNPQWAVDAVYSVLVDTEIGKNSGRFKKEKLKAIWTQYSRDEQAKLLNLMKKDNFEICYELKDEDGTYIAPQLLQNTPPTYEWEGENSLKFRFQYSFMPHGIITRLMVRLNELIVDGIVWKKGLIVKQNGAKAKVVEEENRAGLKVIDIEIIGLKQKRKYLLFTIREEIKSIQKKWFKNIKFDEMIPCICSECKESDTPQYFKYSILEKYQDKGKKTIECQESIEDIEVLRLLEGLSVDKEIKHFDYDKLRDDLINIALLETKSRNSIFKESEDETNDRFATALVHKNYNVADQSRGGESSSGINAGERDLVIRNREGSDESVIEAFILDSLSSNVINKHYEKLVNRYDTVGNRVNFVLVYAKSKNFDGLWKKYITFDGFENFKDTRDNFSKKDNLRVGISKYNKMKIYHLFINFYSHGEG